MNINTAAIVTLWPAQNYTYCHQYPYIIRYIYVKVNNYNTVISYDRLRIIAAGIVKVMGGKNTHECHRRY